MSETWSSGNHCLCSIYNSSPRQQIFLTLDSQWSLAPSSIAIGFPSPLLSRPSPPCGSSQPCHTFLQQPRLFQYTQPPQPTLSVSNADNWQIYSHSWKDSMINLQRGRFILSSAGPLESQFLQQILCCLGLGCSAEPLGRLPRSQATWKTSRGSGNCSSLKNKDHLRDDWEAPDSPLEEAKRDQGLWDTPGRESGP